MPKNSKTVEQPADKCGEDASADKEAPESPSKRKDAFRFLNGPVAKTGPGTGVNGSASAGPQVFDCKRCLKRFTDFRKLRKHQAEAHGM